MKNNTWVKLEPLLEFADATIDKILAKDKRDAVVFICQYLAPLGAKNADDIIGVLEDAIKDAKKMINEETGRLMMEQLNDELRQHLIDTGIIKE